MWNGVGGGTVVYAAQWQRNMPSDFRVKTLDGIADDWPLTYEDLEPYYERVERDFGISGLANDTAFPPGEGPPLPPVPLGPAGPARGEGAQRAGLALVAGAERDRDARLRRAPRLPAGRHLPAGLRVRREGHGRPHALAEGDRARRRAAHRRARAAS